MALAPVEGGAPPSGAALARPEVQGKFLYAGGEKLWVKGVTYGSFGPGTGDAAYPPRDVAAHDFAAMRAAGLNAVRVYTVPPRWLLDLAAEAGLRLLIGLPGEQHFVFLDDRVRRRAIKERIAEGVRACAGHPAVLAYSVGNEIPATIVRWNGKRRIDAWLRGLCALVRRADPGALVTYMNYPTTEYLDPAPFDFVSFNVYLETRAALAGYLARLQNIAGDKPLVLAEIGLDSRRNGEDAQAETLAWQLETAFAAGCAGSFVFAWTDEWHHGGHPIEDWDFGLTTRAREPKPVLARVAAAFRQVPFGDGWAWPRVSVVVCSYNGAATIGETLAALERLDYPDYEVIVVDDGSTDATAAIAAAYRVHLVRTENHGLSQARNTGLAHATGEIVAYIDDDAWPDPHWLRYLAHAFLTTGHAAIGGPNLAPPGDGPVADCVAHAPGGPVHVLLTDTLAEHVPGCNLAARRERLLAVDGFDPRFRIAGDDVDLCWRLQARDWTLGFSPAALVWHHRRNSVRRYWRQQLGYAEAEALLAEKWPEKYNSLGHLSWRGRLYGNGLPRAVLMRPRIYHGVWGSAPFQSVYQPASGLLASLPLMPEWYVLVAVLALMSALGLAWPGLRWAGPLLALALGWPLAHAVAAALRARFETRPLPPARRAGLVALTAWLHLIQPLARLLGRIRHGLGPWARRGARPAGLAWPRQRTIWSEVWQPAESWPAAIEAALAARGTMVARGSTYDRWDLTIAGGPFGAARCLVAVEAHGGGRLLVRARAWPRVPPPAAGLAVFLLGLAGLAASDAAWFAGGTLAAIAAGLGWRCHADCARAMSAWDEAVATVADGTPWSADAG